MLISAKRAQQQDESKYGISKDRISQIGLSLLSTQLINNNNKQTSNGDQQHLPHRASNPNIDDISLASLKHYLGTSNLQQKSQQHKPISINNLVFKDNNRYTRVLSAKTQKTLLDKPLSNFDLQIQPPSPVQFQSLQPESYVSNINSNSEQQQQHQQQQQQQKRLSPVSVTNLTINGNAPQYFSQKRSSNILGLQQVAAQKNSLKQG